MPPVFTTPLRKSTMTRDTLIVVAILVVTFIVTVAQLFTNDPLKFISFLFGLVVLLIEGIVGFYILVLRKRLQLNAEDPTVLKVDFQRRQFTWGLGWHSFDNVYTVAINRAGGHGVITGLALDIQTRLGDEYWSSEDKRMLRNRERVRMRIPIVPRTMTAEQKQTLLAFVNLVPAVERTGARSELLTHLDAITTVTAQPMPASQAQPTSTADGYGPAAGKPYG